MHVIVVGSGIAGLTAALRADARGHDVTLISKASLDETNTRCAQGGIAAALFEGDSDDAHAADTLAAGSGLCSSEAVHALCTEGPDRVRELVALGVPFDRSDAGLARGLEAAHSHPRILHAGGDATGLVIETSLIRAVRATRIRVMEHCFVTKLAVRDGVVRGVEVLVAPAIDADAVILATGGAGQLYPHTTNPAVATGDGVALAYRAGATIADPEFYQFHPTKLAVSGGLLISEAVRGEGAVLLDSNGSRFMARVHPDAELAPRDVVARGIARQATAQGSHVLLDATLLGVEFLARRFPTIDAACRAAGLDWSRAPIPVTPAAHFWMGGVATDIDGRSSLPGLFVVGEAACTGVHGANRLASNSLLEGLVFATRAVDALTEPFVTATSSTGGAAQRVDFGAAQPLPVRSTVRTGRAVGSGSMPEPVEDLSRAALQRLMWAAAGLERDAATLTVAAQTLDHWAAPGPSWPSPRTAAEHEDANLLELARMIVDAALAREESRGGHFRSDFPEPAEPWRQHTRITQPVDIHREVSIAC